MALRRDGTVTGAVARELLGDLPISWPWLREVANREEQRAAVGAIPAFPVVVKVEGIAHRQQMAGIWRDIADSTTALSVLDLFGRSFGYPLSVAEQVPHGPEFALGWQRRQTGEDVLMFGHGGSDVGGRVEFRLVPLTRRHASALIGEYVPQRAARDQMIGLALALQRRMRLPGGDGISEIDLNPITFDQAGRLVALDWKIFRR
jgi:hypothetical protein